MTEKTFGYKVCRHEKPEAQLYPWETAYFAYLDDAKSCLKNYQMQYRNGGEFGIVELATGRVIK